MADENQDQSQKTEEPTQKKLDDAKEKGQVAKSQEVNHWFMILASTVMVMMFLPTTMKNFGGLLQKFIEQPHLISVDKLGLRATLADTIQETVFILLPTLVLFVLAAIAAGVIQNGLIISAEQMKPKLSKISMKSGLKRLFSMKSIAEFSKGIAKIAIVASVGIAIIWPAFSGLERLPSMELISSIGVLYSLTIRLMIGVLAIVSLIAVLDFLFQRFQHLKEMKMSIQDIKDEMKQSEGDPQVKARLRQIRRERAQQRMMQAVPEASVVIANPTHFAVALKYELNEMAAPVVLAKGIDAIALRIREVAEENDIPVITNPPLARALHAGAEIGDEIPAEQFKAVAEIIGYVLRLKGKLPGVARRPAGVR
ncbi:MAG: flagellar biosynthesis protein FlhB [Rhodospirillaceae bacterium]|jgi:flagellar biosynthetic protein FlhB|nr:flagellar biosynthesis protein FlhB [Rhodospirillaceae bacterium]MBT5458896.1 flagellar biosynthesis protein FlhB [Rhodospirillaceae bacterium]